MILLMGMMLDRAIYSLGATIGNEIIKNCTDGDACFETTTWKVANYMTWFAIFSKEAEYEAFRASK